MHQSGYFFCVARKKPKNRQLRSLNPLSLRDIPLSGGMPDPASLRSAEPGCLRCFDVYDISLPLRYARCSAHRGLRPLELFVYFARDL